MELMTIFLYPMLLQTHNEPFDSPDYLHEVKLNGIRLIYTKDIKGNEKLYTRHRTEITSKFIEILQLPVPNDSVLDGELVCFQKTTNGIYTENFSRIMQRFRLSNSVKIENAVLTFPATYMVFDVLKWNSVPMVKKTLLERKRLLSSEFIETDYVKLIQYCLYNGISLFKKVKEYEREGIVSKRLNSPYLVAKRASNREWLKIINWTIVDEAYIMGYRKKKFGLLTSRIDEWSGEARPLGIVEFGMSPEQKKAFYRVSKQLIIGEDKNFVYLEPVIRCKLKGRGFSDNGYLITPIFVDFIL